MEESLRKPASAQRERFYRPELDALRFLAFLFVFYRHAVPLTPDWYMAKLHMPSIVADALVQFSLLGAFGVYLFFLLSAYLITVLLVREKEQYGKLHVPQFYGRRALRIWPLYFFIIGVDFIYHIFYPPVEWEKMAMLLFFSGNWAMIFGIAKLSPFWSVSVEEQFYLLWPPIVARLSHRAVERAGFLALLAPLVTLVMARFLHRSGWPFWLVGSFSGFSAMGVGIVLACRTWGDIPRKLPPRPMLWAISLLFWFCAAALQIGDTSPACSLAGIALINLGSLGMLLAVLGTKPHKVFVELGKISYGLYMWHGWVIAVFNHAIQRESLSALIYPLLMALELALTMAVAWASYRWLEAPFLRLKERLTFVKSRPV